MNTYTKSFGELLEYSPKPARHNKLWTTNEQHILDRLLVDGYSPQKIATKFERANIAITSRMAAIYRIPREKRMRIGNKASSSCKLRDLPCHATTHS